MISCSAAFSCAVLAVAAPNSASGAGLPLAPAAQRGEVFFEMLKHLEEFERHYLSKYNTLYDFTPFEAKSKEWISRRELEELRAAWKVERERVAVEIERIESDPKVRSLFRVRRKVEKNAFFSSVDKTWVEEHAPFYYVVQRPPKDEAGYYARKAGDYARWAEALYEVFREEYAEPLELQMRPDRQVFVTAVLASEGAYKDYAIRNQAMMLPGMRAHYDPRLRVAVTYEPWAGGAQTADERRHALMHELVHAFQHAYCASADDLPQHPWLNEGFAEYLSSGTSGDVSSLREHPLDDDARRTIARILRSEDQRDVYLLPLEDLLDAKSYGHVVRKTWERSRGAAFSADRAFSAELALSAFYRQAYLFVYYLNREANGRHRAPFEAYLRSYFAGKGAREDFERAFDGLDLGRLEADYLAWIEPKTKGWRPPRISARAAAEAGAAPGEPPPPPYDPDALLALGRDPEVALAVSVWEVLEGRPEDARARLESAAEELDAGDGRLPRLAREIERVNGWIALRDRFLGWLRDEGRKLAFELGGKKVRAPVEDVRAGLVVLGPNARELESVPLSALEPVALVKEMIKARGFEKDWTRLYVELLGGRENWRKKLPADDPAAESLLEDAEEYPQLLAEGELAARLLALASSPLPEEPDEAGSVLAEIEELFARRDESPSVARAAEPLTGLAHVCAQKAVEGASLDELLAGEVEKLGKRRVRIRYDFDSEAELGDFVAIEFRETFPVSQSEAAAGSFESGSGELVGRGRAALRHLAEFEGPQTVRYTVEWSQAGFPADLGLGLCHDGADSFVMCMDAGSLVVLDQRGGAPQMVGSPVELFAKKAFEIELHLDGSGSFSGSVNGEAVGPLASGELKRGGLFLYVNSVMGIEIDRLEIEAKLRLRSLDGLRRAWARRRVEALTP